ncbi:MAG: hypothetical protein HYV07_17955 [Deltaproteobacteria bacterium]|nr:hypothetical protein [Deltaproteobacteria bacterium]
MRVGAPSQVTPQSEPLVDVGGLTPQQAISQYGLDPELVRRAVRYPLQSDGTYAKGMKLNVESLAARAQSPEVSTRSQDAIDPATRTSRQGDIQALRARGSDSQTGPKVNHPLSVAQAFSNESLVDLGGMTPAQAVERFGLDPDLLRQVSRYPMSSDGTYAAGMRVNVDSLAKK